MIRPGRPPTGSSPRCNAEGGSIVLMHLGGYETFEALPRIVDGLEAAGYDLVALGEIVGG